MRNCRSLPSEIHKLKQSNMNIEKELKSIKDILEDQHKGSTNENKIEHKTPLVTKTHDCCTNSSRKLHDNCKMNEQRLTFQHNEDEIASDLKTKRLVIEENIALKRGNSHLKDRL